MLYHHLNRILIVHQNKIFQLNIFSNKKYYMFDTIYIFIFLGFLLHVHNGIIIFFVQL